MPSDEDLYSHEPTQKEVEQHEEEGKGLPPVNVVVLGPVKAQTMPAESWGAMTYDLSATEAIKIAKADPRRARAIINVTTQAAWLGPSQSGTRVGTGFRHGAGAQVFSYWTHTGEIWAIAEQAGSSLAIAQEYWTE